MARSNPAPQGAPKQDQTPQSFAMIGANRARALVVRAEVRPPPASGYLIAEGDAWLDDPGYLAILETMERHHGFQVECAAGHGETAEEMAYDDRQLERFRKVFERLARVNDAIGSTTPRAILLSCGGNDVAHTLSTLINHVDSGLPVLDAEMVRSLIEDRVRSAVSSLIGSAMAFSDAYFKQMIPIFIHGNARPVPDRRRYKRTGIRATGPWLRPGSADRTPAAASPQADGDLLRNTAEIAKIIDLFNDRVLASLPSVPPFAGVVHYIPLRPTFEGTAATAEQRRALRNMFGEDKASERAAKAIADAINAVDRRG